MTPVQHTLKHLRAEGYFPWPVERNIPCRPPRKVDMYNIIDYIAIKPGSTIGVQITDGVHFAEHDTKILNHENSLKWVMAGNGLWLYGWRKLKVKRNMKATTWEPRIKIYTPADFKPTGMWECQSILRREA